MDLTNELRQMIADEEAWITFDCAARQHSEMIGKRAQRLAAYKLALANLETQKWLADLTRNKQMPFRNSDVIGRLRA